MDPAGQVVVCVPTSSGASVAPCTTGSDGTIYVPTVITGHLLTDAEYASLQLASAPVDWNAEQYYFEYGLALPLLALMVGLAVGSCLRLLRMSVR